MSLSTSSPAPVRIPVRTLELHSGPDPRNDERADFEALFRKYRDPLHNFLFRRLGSHEDAEDAVVMTFHNAWRGLDAFRGDAPDKAWLYQIATRVSLDMLRRRRRRGQDQSLDDELPGIDRFLCDQTPDPADMVLDAAQRSDTRRVLQQAIRRLSPDQRRLLRLYYFQGMRYEQICDLLDIPYTKVRGRLNRIRHLIRTDMVGRQQWLPD